MFVFAKLDQRQWEAVGRDLYGDDKAAWQFQCPSCGHVASIERAKREWPELEGRGWNPASECVGRYLEGVGCDWAAYGLFRGPLLVTTEGDGTDVCAFDFDARTYAAREVTPLVERGDA